MIREEARLNAAKFRETAQQEAIGFASRKEGALDEANGTRRDGRDVVAGSRSENNNAGYGSKFRDRVCSNCGKTGHEKNNCWQIIGFPEWMNDRRGRGSGRGGRGSDRGGYGRGGANGRGAAHTAHATSSSQGGGADLSPEQWRAITQIINEGRSKGQSEKLSGKPIGDVIIDSGASHHMTGNISLLIT